MRRASMASVCARALAAATFVALSAAAPAAAQSQATITVDTTADVVDFGGAQTVADLPGPDGRTTLREATIAATNTAGPDTIAFDIPTSDPGFDGAGFTVRTGADAGDLTIGDDATTIDATTQPGGFSVTVAGPGLDVFRRGLLITSSGNTVRGLGVRGYSNGIQVQGSDNAIAGVTATGNRQGVFVNGGPAVSSGNAVTDGTFADNAGFGVGVQTTVGSLVDGNTISRNGTRGVFISNADEVTVTGNLISENAFHGIDFQTEIDFAFVPDPATRGGVASGNTIVANSAVGVRVDGADRFTITRNAITGNAGLGIDLTGGKQDAFGVTRNDAGDRDGGANQRLNYPERLAAVDDGTATVVEGRVDVSDPQSLTIELFAGDAPDGSGFGEGERFVGSATADARGRFTVTLPAGLAGAWLTATSTDAAGNSSEFSEAVLVGDPR